MINLIRETDKPAREAMLEKIKSRSIALDIELTARVAQIVAHVRARGDAALIDYAAQFDRVELRSGDLRVNEASLRESASRIDPFLRDSLRKSIANVREFHERQIEKTWEFYPRPGVTLGQRVTPIERAGIYVPGGTAAYPSSLIMNVVPAQIAGVERIVVATPPNTVINNSALAAALVELKVTEVYNAGGAQAIAALAFGTETVPRVDKITGPGNKYVAAAKRLVFGAVGIDSIAGPTEVVIIADDTARADFVAADLLAQAEHDEQASAVLITTSDRLANSVRAEVDRQIRKLSRRSIIEASLAQFGAILVVADLDEACAIANDLAPEHLEIVTANDESVAAKIKHAGAIFFGAFTPEAVGDYFAGPNHVLPTSGTARFSSALGVYDFVKRTSVLRYSENEMKSAAAMIAAIADAEGLDAHSQSATIRAGK
jgi:histidinol dehydrogenase